MWGASLLLAAAPALARAGPSLSSCGAASDWLTSPTFEVSPDPIDPKSPFSITVLGNLAHPLTNGTVALDLDAKVKIFGETLLDDKVKETARFEFLPGFEAGATKLVVGPVSLPGKAPGGLDVQGKIVIGDVSGAQVACIALDLHLELFAAPLTAGLPAPDSVASPSSCTKPADHMKDLEVDTSDGVALRATMDEDVQQMSFDAELKVKYGFFSVPVSLSVPVSFSPGIKKGPIAVKCGLAHSVRSERGHGGRAALPEISGDIVWNDAGKEEIACLHIDETPLAAPTSAGPLAIVV